MKIYQEKKEKGLPRPRVPLVIQLRDFAKMLESSSLISDFFFKKHEIKLPGYSSFEHLNRMGKLLLIFDGFDEMADKVDKQKMINNFWELAKVVVPGAKVLLTCRTEHFPEATEGRKLLNAELKASTANLTGEPPQFEILHLEMFNDDQIQNALLMRTDQEDIDKIIQHKDLLDLARRPVMMEFIIDALPEIKTGERIDMARVYLYAVRRKMDRDIHSNRTFTYLADKLFFMCELSWEMMTQDKMSINYRLFPERLKNLFGDLVAEEKDLDHFHHDMMGQTLLIRNEDGDYSPAHRSLVEFFAATRACACLGFLPSDFLDLLRQREDVDASRPAKNYTWSSYFHRKTDSDGTIKSIAPLENLLPDDPDSIMEALGGISENTISLMHEITQVDEICEEFHTMLQSLIDDFKDGSRDMEGQQNVLVFIYRMRSKYINSLGYEKSNPVFGVWTEYHEKEKEKAKGLTKKQIIEVTFEGGSKYPIKFIKVPPGEFFMGDENFGPIKRIRVEKPFFIAKYPVTQAMYQIVTGRNPSHFIIHEKNPQRPVENVSWFDAVQFCNKLSTLVELEPAYEIKDKIVRQISDSPGFRLATDTEWEYACRAGSTFPRYGHPDEIAWHMSNSGFRIHSVGQKKSNFWGINDMLGNVWEWCWNASDNETRGRIVRGGSYNFFIGDIAESVRIAFIPNDLRRDIGFRICRD